MATDPRTIINPNTDPGLNPQDTSREAYPDPTPVTQTVTLTYTNPPLYGVPELQIINDPGGNSDGQIQFNQSNRFAADNNFRWDTKRRSLIVNGDLRVTGDMYANFTTSVGRFKLYGGEANDVLATDGNGNISWANLDSLSYGNSEVANYLPTYSGDLRGLNINISDTARLYNTLSEGLSIVTDFQVSSLGSANLGSINNITITGGESGQFLTTDGNGSLSWVTSRNVMEVSDTAPAINFEGQMWFDSVEGRTYISYQNTWVDTSPVLASDPDVTANTITFLDGTVQTTAFNGVSLGNWNAVNNTIYNINGGTINNSDLSHGPTALLSLPSNGDTNNMTLLNYYGGLDLVAGVDQGNTVAWNFSNAGETTIPGNLILPSAAVIKGDGASPAPSLSGFYSVEAGYLSGEGGNISNIQVGNISGLGNIATANLDGNSNNVLYGNGEFAALPSVNTGDFTFTNNDINTANNAANITLNITGVGGKTWIYATNGDFYSAGNVQGGNFIATGNITFNNWMNTAGGTNMILNPGTSQIRAIANLEPYHNDSWILGNDNARWKTVYANAGNFSGALVANRITLSSTGIAVNASQGNILTNEVTGTKFNFLNGLYTASITGGGATSNYSLNLPSDTGTDGQLLTTDGTGNLSWTSPASTYGDSNVSSLLSSFGSNTITTTGDVSVGNITATNLGNLSSINKDGNTSNVLYGNGVFSAITAGTTLVHGNSNVVVGANSNVTMSANGTANILDVGSDGRIRLGGQKQVMGNGTDGYFQLSTNNFGIGGNLQLLAQQYIKGAGGVSVIQLNSPNNTDARIMGNLAVGSSNTGNLYGGNASFSGNVTANNFSGNISITGNVTGTSPNVTLVAGSYSAVFDNTGNATFPGLLKGLELTSTQSSGDEGGQVNLAVPATNTTLTNSVTVDIYRNQFRIFEGGTAQGVFIDLGKAPAGVGGELSFKASGLVNAGTFVTLDNIKATVTTSGNRGLSLAAVSGSFVINISGTYATTSSSIGGTAAVATITTTPGNSAFGWSFPGQGDTSTYIITDTTNSRAYRITLQIGASYNNNFISIERLH
jgi:hypothetical protein